MFLIDLLMWLQLEKKALYGWYFSYMWTQKPFYHTVVQKTSPPVCSCTSAAALSKQTSVGEPKSAEGLQVLVSGSAVPALLRTGEDGAAPAEGSGTLEVCRRMPCLWRRAHVELQLRRSSYKSWTWGATEAGKRWKNWDLQILRWKEIIEGMTCFPFFWGRMFSRRIVIEADTATWGFSCQSVCCDGPWEQI